MFSNICFQYASVGDDPIAPSDRLPKSTADELGDDDNSTDFFGLKGTSSAGHAPGRVGVGVMTPGMHTGVSSAHAHTPLDTRRTHAPVLEHHNATLSSYACWKCNRTGHLPVDCTVGVAERAARELQAQTKSLASGAKSVAIAAHAGAPKLWQEYMQRCAKIRKDSASANCAVCGVGKNLVHCFDCGSYFCDGKGHVTAHLQSHPSHGRLFSCKMGRMVKCANSQCDELDSRRLIACVVCFDKIRDRHYSMYSATWSRDGLKAISNAVACSEHFMWHRMNCSKHRPVDDTPLVCDESISQSTLSECLF
eukprot:Opistho-2@88935